MKDCLELSLEGFCLLDQLQPNAYVLSYDWCVCVFLGISPRVLHTLQNVSTTLISFFILDQRLYYLMGLKLIL